jgi:multiple sugar transport system permease protein
MTVVAPAKPGTSETVLKRGLTSDPKKFGRTLVWPGLFFLLLVGLFPTVYVFVIAFTKYEPGAPMTFVGINNFVRALSTPRFWHGLEVTAWFAIGGVVIQLVLGFIMALALQAVSPRVRRAVTTLFLVPFMMTPAVVATLWKLIYHPTIGPLNYTLSLIGIKAPEWAASEFALPALVVADVWQWTPFMTILLLAGLQSLSREVYEAAYMDGATGWRAFRDHTLPLMKPFIFLAVFLRFIDAFKLFDLVFIVTRGGPGDATESISFFTYTMGFKYFDLGLAAALSVLQLIIIIIAGKLLLSQLSRVQEAQKVD